MSQGAPTLSEVLEGHVPLTSNRPLIEALTTARESRFLAVVLSPSVQLGSQIIPPLLEVLETLPEGGGLDLFVDCLGGASEEAWRIVSILRERFDRYTAIVPFSASPGASQVALGADELMMGEASSLAPLEPARLRKIELAGGNEKVSMSAYDVHHYLSFLERELRLEGGLSASSPILEQILARIDPLVVGATEKAHQVNRLVTRRCLETHLDPDRDHEQIERILEELGAGFISHKFPVTRRDCENRLGLRVLKPDRDLWASIWSLHGYYTRMWDLEGELVLADKYYCVGYDGFIDTADERRVLIRITRTDERGRPLTDKPTLHRWVRPKGRDVVLDQELEL